MIGTTKRKCVIGGSVFDDPRSGDDPRDRHDRNRDHGADPRDLFTRDLELPRGPEREIVHDVRGREFTLRGSESRTLATVGAFRVVSSRDLSDNDGRPARILVLEICVTCANKHLSERCGSMAGVMLLWCSP